MMTESAFLQNYRMDYHMTDSQRTLRPSGLLDYLQSTAVKHSDEIGYTLDYFEREKIGWMLTGWHVRIRRWPEEGEELLFATWSDLHTRITANRDFSAEDAEGNEIVNASSRWVLVDTARRRPTRPKPGFVDPYRFPQCRPLAEEVYALPDTPDREPDAAVLTSVTRRDIDTNGHTNNSVYLDWVCDSIPDEIYDRMKPFDIRVEYKRECVRGDQLKVSTWLDKSDDSVSSFTIIHEAEDPDQICGKVLMEWR